MHTLVGGNTIAAKAIMHVCQLLASDSVDRSIVVSSEELNELSYFCHSRLGKDTSSEGAGAILIENEDTMEGLPYCYISGFSSRFNPSDLQAAFAVAIKKSLEMAGLDLKDIDLAMTDSPAEGIGERYLNNIPAAEIISLTGNAFAVTTLWHIILSAMILKNKTIPASIVVNKTNNNNDVRHVMICSVEDEGAASAVILSRYE